MVRLPAMLEQHHSVKFYEDEAFLFESVVPFLRAGLRAKGTAIAVAASEHCKEFEKELAAWNLTGQNRLVVMDGREALSRFMVNDWPSEPAFLSCFEDLVAEASAAGPVSIFGEMVAILWDEDKWKAAIRLEEIWNRLAGRYLFSLLCAYPLGAFKQEEHTDAFLDICGVHSRIILTSACR
ncbi:MAG TPA: MEDS domain-containing protein [Nitrospira sp.]|nr:MEDS domain-containing protein [Nitrospira sp.]